MGMTVEDLSPLLEHPETEPDVPIVGTFGAHVVRTGRGADGQEYAQVHIFDSTGVAQVFVRKADWGAELRRTPTVCTMAFKFVLGRHGDLVPFGIPATGLIVGERSSLELLPVHACPDSGDVERLTLLVDSLSTAGFRRFLENVFSDQSFTWTFLTQAAGQRCHHAFPGGLLKHSLEVAEGVQAMMTAMPSNRLMGEAAVLIGLLHDVGKVALSQADGYRIPCKQRDHGRLIQYALQKSLVMLKYDDRDAHDALWRVLHAYQSGEHYDVPLAAVVQAADRASAQIDAVRKASGPPGEYWKRGCGGRRIWDPPG